MKIFNQIFFSATILSIIFSFGTLAQTDSTYLKTEEILEDILQEPINEIDESDLYEQLELLMLNPINLNTASVDELLSIPIMEISAAKLIVEHRNKFGYFFSVNELYAVDKLDRSLIAKVTPFLYIKKAEVEQTEPPGTFESLTARSKILLRSRIINSQVSVG